MNELSITLIAYVLTFNCINGKTIAPSDNQRQQIYFQSRAMVNHYHQWNVRTYANNVIESSFTLMKFMEVVMNVYLRYSFNC